MANKRATSLTWERSIFIAKAVDGHPLLIEKLVDQVRRRDLDELLEVVAKKEGILSHGSKLSIPEAPLVSMGLA